VPAGEQAVRTVGAAVDAFLARGDFAASSAARTQTFNRLAADIGADTALALLDADALGGAMHGVWGACAPATWNRHVATVRSFVAFCRRAVGWPPMSRPVAIVDASRPITLARSRMRSLSGCGVAAMSRFARRRCGACCMRLRRARRRCCRSMSATSTWTIAARRGVLDLELLAGADRAALLRTSRP
jgi:hypothetical protein